MCVEISAGIGAASRNLNEAASLSLLEAMRAFDAAVPLLEDEHRMSGWRAALEGLEADDGASALLRGFSLRRLYDAGARSEADAAIRLSRGLSPAVPVQAGGQWLEGFLNRSAQLLIHDAKLFGLIDDWIMGVPEDAFVELLPVLRRAVSSFDSMERRRLLEKVKSGAREETASASIAVDGELPPGFLKALPLVQIILGIEP
jgi:hypothetical protein